MELQEQFPTMTGVRDLEYMGFSSEQVANLFRVKALYQQGAYHEATPEYKRMAKGEQCLSLMRALQVMQPAPNGSRSQRNTGGQLWNYKSSSQP